MSAVKYAVSLLVLWGFAVASPQAVAQVGGGLEEFKAINEIRAQKLRGEVKSALDTSSKLIRTNAVKARDLLRDVLRKLEDDFSLPQSERQSLELRVRRTLQVVIPYARAQSQKSGQLPPSTGKKYSFKSPYQSGVTPKGSSKFDIANKAINNRKSNAYQIQKQRNASNTARRSAFLELDKSASNILEKRITERFVTLAAKRAKPKLTKREALLLKVLNSTLSVDFPQGTTFKEALGLLQEKTGQPIIVDKASMREAMIQYDDEVSFKINKAAVRTILRKLLGEFGMTYVIVEGTLQAVTHQRARDMMTARVYPVDDLLGTDPLIDQYYGPFVGEAVRTRNAQFLIRMIQSSVDPSIWDVNGGRASITYHPGARSLIVRAPAEIHYMMK